MCGKMRPRKDGGYSECFSPDDKVGKGRCCHIMGNEDQPSMEIVNIQRGMYGVNIGENDKISIQAEREAVVKFFDTLQHIDEGKIHKIIDFLEEE